MWLSKEQEYNEPPRQTGERGTESIRARGVYGVSLFYLKKTYDMTWRHGILEELHSDEMRGHLPKYIQEFLKDRNF